MIDSRATCPGMGGMCKQAEEHQQEWNIIQALSHDELMLVSVEMPNPIWLENKLFNDEINQKFPVFYQSIKKWQKRGCAMCGTKGIRLLPYQNVLPSPIEELHVPCVNHVSTGVKIIL